MRRSGFTLIELLIIVGIIAAMAGTAVVSVFAGRGAISMRMASRGVLQYVRHARNVALLSQQAVVLTIEERKDEAENPVTILTLKSRASAFAAPPLEVENLQGEKIDRRAKGDEASGDGDSQDGKSLTDMLSLLPKDPIAYTGVCCRVELKPIDLSDRYKVRTSGISVFSNVGYLTGQSSSTNDTDEASSSSSSKSKSSSSTSKKSEGQEPVNIVYEVNGRCTTPFRLRLFREGQENRDVRVIDVDVFGKMTVEDDAK